MRNPFGYFNSSPKVIRLAVMMYVRYPLSLRQVEDLLFERGIDVCHETVRFWWNRFGPMFASEIKRRVDPRNWSNWRSHLHEVFVQNGLRADSLYHRQAEIWRRRSWVTVFKDASYNVTGLLSRIQHGEIALPDIQRPFVWSNARVRDLFDSMYKGFPVGYLLLWSTGADTGAKHIGTDDKQAVPSLLIVDGQQRLTSLYAVITGTPVVRKDYSEGRLRIAFRPDDQTFEVTDAAVENDPEFIPDISEIFEGEFYSFASRYLEKVENYRNIELDKAEKNRLVENIDRLKDLQNYPFQAIELDREVDEEHVAEVFVRINSEGVRLNNADFILTLMSVFWEKGRRELEDFSRLAKVPSTDGPSPFNHFIEPSPDQLLRSSVGLAFRRGRLHYVYSILRGKDLDTGQFSTERRDSQFSRLQVAHDATLDPTNWHEYLNPHFPSDRFA